MSWSSALDPGRVLGDKGELAQQAVACDPEILLQLEAILCEKPVWDAPPMVLQLQHWQCGCRY